MQHSKDFLQACHELAEDTYTNHKGIERRRAYLSELLMVSKFLHSESEDKKIQNLEEYELKYFTARCQLTETQLKYTLKEQNAYRLKCTKHWAREGFSRILNDVGDRYKLIDIRLVDYKSFNQGPDLKINIEGYFIYINNISDIPIGDYYFIFQLEDIWSGQRTEIAYFMDFDK